jgi:hypothetical protein
LSIAIWEEINRLKRMTAALEDAAHKAREKIAALEIRLANAEMALTVWRAAHSELPSAAPNARTLRLKKDGHG